MFPKKFPKLKKNTKRAIPKETAEVVIERDGCCIICTNHKITQIHHCFFGASSNYSETRNDIDQLAGLCENCHHSLHFEGGNDYRERCINYLKSIYQ